MYPFAANDTGKIWKRQEKKIPWKLWKSIFVCFARYQTRRRVRNLAFTSNVLEWLLSSNGFLFFYVKKLTVRNHCRAENSTRTCDVHWNQWIFRVVSCLLDIGNAPFRCSYRTSEIMHPPPRCLPPEMSRRTKTNRLLRDAFRRGTRTLPTFDGRRRFTNGISVTSIRRQRSSTTINNRTRHFFLGIPSLDTSVAEPPLSARNSAHGRCSAKPT